MPVRVDTYQPLFFDVSAKLLIDARYLWSDVRAAATNALIGAFSFGRRAFAQPVRATEVVTILQNLPGVVFVDLDALHRFDQPASLPANGVVAAGQVVWKETDNGPSALAELLLVNPLGITLSQISDAVVSGVVVQP